MKNLSICSITLACVIPVLAVSGRAADAGDDEGGYRFKEWRISAGPALNSIGSSRLRSRRHYGKGIAPARLSTLPTSRQALENAKNRKYDGKTLYDENGKYYLGGTIDPDYYDDDAFTINWTLPTNCRRDDDLYPRDTFRDYYSCGNRCWRYRDDDYDLGISLELSKTIYDNWEDADYELHQRNRRRKDGEQMEDERQHWGVDLAFGFSYFFDDNLYRDFGEYGHYRVLDGHYETPISGYDTKSMLMEYDAGGIGPQDGYYGDKAWSGGPHPSLYYNDIGSISGPIIDGTSAYWGGEWHSGNGKYRELEAMLVLKPWYELSDWCRIFGTIGVAAYRGRFSFRYTASDGVNWLYDRQRFDEWGVCGVGGGGIVFRYGDFDISADILARFLQDDMDINGRHVKGWIERADWMVRIMVGYEF